MNLRKIPWRAVRQAHFILRRAFFTIPKPDRPGLVVSNTAAQTQPLVERIEDLLGDRYFSANLFSYNYKGEILNMRRVIRDPGRVEGVEVFQEHVRGFDHPAGLELLAHYEPCALTHPKVHLSSKYVDWDEGRARLKAVLDDANEQYTPAETTNA